MTLQKLRGSLFWKYLIVTLLMVSTVFVGVTAVELFTSYQDIKRITVELETEKAVSVVNRIEQFVEPAVTSVKSTMGESVLQSVGYVAVEGAAKSGDPPQFLLDRAEAFNRMLRDDGDIASVQLIDASGRERVVVSRSAPVDIDSGSDFTTTPEFVKGRGGKVYFGPVYFRNNTDPRMRLAVSAHKDSDVTVVELNLTPIWDAAAQVRSGREGYAYIVDRDGRAITHPDLATSLRRKDLSGLPQVAQALAEAREAATRPKDATGDSNAAKETGKEAAASAPSLVASVGRGRDGGEALIAHAVSPTLGWLVFVERPLSELHEQFRSRLLRSAMILVLGLALAGILAALLAERMVAPIRLLQDGAARIGRGELDHRINVKTGDELQLLAEEINLSASQLAEAQHGLEQKVEARTEELNRSVGELQVLSELTQAVNSSLNVQDVLDKIVTHAVKLSGAREGTMYTLDGDALTQRANFGRSESMLKVSGNNKVTINSDSIGARCLRERAPVQIPDIEKEKGYRLRDQMLAEGIHSNLGVPLIHEDKVIGALVVRRAEKGYCPDATVKLLQTFAAQSAMAIQNARLFGEIQEKGEQLAAASQLKSDRKSVV